MQFASTLAVLPNLIVRLGTAMAHCELWRSICQHLLANWGEVAICSDQETSMDIRMIWELEANAVRLQAEVGEGMVKLDCVLW